MTDPEIPALREAMLDAVLAAGHAQRPDVEQALRAVPRHAFIPEAPLQEALDAHTAYVTARDADGRSRSSASASAPVVVAMMLDQLGIRPGQRVLEIGSGTGYNAALLDHLVGPNGQVVTVDIDPAATTRTRTALDTTGHHRVEVITRDGTDGAPGHPPFDRIIITAGAWDVPPAWTEQLTPDGRLVLPLRWRGQTRSVAFTHHPHQQLLRSDSLALCGFIPMTSRDGERSHPLDPHHATTLHHDHDQHIDPTRLHNLLHQPRLEDWSPVTVGPQESIDGIWTRISIDEPHAAWLTTDPAQDDSTGNDAVPPLAFRPRRTSCIVDGDSLALFQFRNLPELDTPSEPRAPEGRSGQLGVLALGPAARELAARVLAAIHTWDTDRTHTPELTLHPTHTPDDQLPRGTVIDKTHRRLVLRYPPR